MKIEGIDVKTKICSKCKRELPLNNYYFQHNKRRKDGWNSLCKECCGSKFNNTGRNWNKKEIDILLEHYPFYSNKELSKEFFNNKRSETQILNKAQKLNLHKDDKYLNNKQIEVGIKNLSKIGDQKGENSPRWSERITINCDFCNKEISRTEYKLSINNNNFCSQECKNKFQSEHQIGINNPNYNNSSAWTEDMKNKIRQSNINYLLKTDFRNKKTNPEIITENLLNELKIENIYEYECKYYLVDFYLSEYNLMIEVQGNFFHCNPTMNLNNIRKSKILRKDKAKHTYIKRYKNIEILYLWEEDIKYNLDLCKKLILEYINKNGDLENYHSFNYQLKNNKLKLIQNLYKIGY